MKTGEPGGGAPPGQVDERILEFVGRLRAAGMQASVAESMDACEAVRAVPLESLGVLRATLGTTLVKNESDYPLFDAVFDEFFSGLALPAEAEDSGDGLDADAAGPGGMPLDNAEMSALLEQVLASGTPDQIDALAFMVAQGIGEMEGGFGAGSRPLSTMAGYGYYVFRALEWLDFRETQARMEALAAEGELEPGVAPVFVQEQLRDRIERFRRTLEREVRRRLAQVRGEEVTDRRRKLPPRPEEIDFTGASLTQIQDMRRVLPVLARKLASRLARKNASGKWGRVDIRNTLRHSLSTGGVPIDVKYRKRVPQKPELFVLCDISGSVRTFSNFTLQLVYSLHQQFRAVRSFAFIDRVDEVTDFFNCFDVDEAVERVHREALVVDGDGHSDVGRALDLFQREFGGELGPRSSVLILSDGRNNSRDPRPESLEKVQETARRVYWLNPEPTERWNTGDSIIGEYVEFCDSIHECRNLKQLAEFVYRGA